MEGFVLQLAPLVDGAFVRAAVGFTFTSEDGQLLHPFLLGLLLRVIVFLVEYFCVGDDLVVMLCDVLS